VTRRDPVTSKTRETVLRRDGGCVAAILNPRHVCRDQWGRLHGPHVLDAMTLDHVQEGYGRMGLRAPSDPAHLVTLCAGAHLLTGWATSHRPELRDYLARVEAAA
jgi:hypothetical protein